MIIYGAVLIYINMQVVSKMTCSIKIIFEELKL